MLNTESYFLESRRNIRKLKTVVNVLEETINVFEEALEESPRLRGLIPDPEQWLQLWADHIDSFRVSTRNYDFMLKQPSLMPHQVVLIYNSLCLYNTQVTQYVQLVQAYCLNLLAAGGEACFSQIEARINHFNEAISHLADLADVSLVKNRLLAFSDLVVRIENLIDEQTPRDLGNSTHLSEETLDSYRQLVTFLQVHIITWEGEISLHEGDLNKPPSSADRSLEASDQIRSFITELGEYTRLVQKIYRNLLEG